MENLWLTLLLVREKGRDEGGRDPHPALQADLSLNKERLR